MTNKIKVFLDIKPLKTEHSARGIGSYTRELFASLKKRKSVKLVSKDEADIIHHPYFDLFFKTLSDKKEKPVVVTIHDVIPLIYPQRYEPGIKGKINFFFQKRKLQKINAIITDSETSKKDIVRFLNLPQEKIFSTHLAPAKDFRVIKDKKILNKVRAKHHLPEKFILYVGDVNYNKNLPNLIRAIALLKDKNVKLVLVGKGMLEESKEKNALVYLIEQTFLRNRVITPGFISQEDLVAIYNLATLYCQPSFYEGFGLPVLEAMACGCPTVCTKTQCLVEVAGGASIFVHPQDPREIANKIGQVLAKNNLLQELKEGGLKHVKNFSWDKTCNETINVYQEVLKKF